MQNVIIIIVFLIFLCCIVCIMSEEAEKATFSISADGAVKAENDMMRSELTIESGVYPEPNASYEAVLPYVEKAKELLEESDRVHNIKIQPRTEPEYSYDKENNRKLKGYRTIIRVSYNSKVKDSESQKEASKIQGALMGMTNQSNGKNKAKVQVQIQNISYYMSDERRVELESEALQTAILRGKAQARVMVRTTYPGRSFRVVDISTGHSGIAYESALQAAPRNGDRNVVSQGDSTITASVSMKVEVI